MRTHDQIDTLLQHRLDDFEDDLRYAVSASPSRRQTLAEEVEFLVEVQEAVEGLVEDLREERALSLYFRTELERFHAPGCQVLDAHYSDGLGDIVCTCGAVKAMEEVPHA